LPVNLLSAYPAPVIGFCPACREPIVEGVLRCRECGADARRAKQAVGMLVRWDDVLPERDLLALDKMHDLVEVAPGVAEWYRAATDAERKVVELLLAELRRLRGKPS
jgi:hypothetical protein